MAPNLSMHKNVNSITIIISLEGVEKIKTKKMTKQFEEYFFHQCGKKIAANTVMASILRLFNSHFSLVNFSQLKYILARKMRHTVRQSDNN